MSIKRSSTNKNYVFNLIYEIVALLIPLITTPYISRVVGPEGIGTYSYTYSIVAYFAFFAALGSTVYARREIAYRQEKSDERTRLFWEVMSLRLITTIITISLYATYILFVSNDIISIIQSLVIISVFFDITWLFQGMENFGIVVFKNLIIKLLGMIFVFLFVKSANDLWLYVLGVVGFPLLGNILLWTSAYKYIGRPRFEYFCPLKHLKGSVLLFIPTIAAQVYLLLDKTFIGIFTETNVENGYYEQAQRIIMMCWTFVTTYSTVMAPRIANIYSNKRFDELHVEMKKTFRFIWFLSMAIFFGVISIAGNLVPWFFGEGYDKVTTLLLIFAFIVFPVGINGAIGSQFLVVTNRHTCYTLSIISGAIVNLVLNLLLIPKYYSIGAAIASVIAECVIATIQIVYVVLIIKEIQLKDIFFKLHRYLISGIIMMTVDLVLSRYLPPSVVSTILLILIGAVVYLTCLFVCKDEIIEVGVSKLKRLVKRYK